MVIIFLSTKVLQIFLIVLLFFTPLILFLIFRAVNPLYSLLGLLFIYLMAISFLLCLSFDLFAFIYLLVYAGAILLLSIFALLLADLSTFKILEKNLYFSRSQNSYFDLYILVSFLSFVKLFLLIYYWIIPWFLSVILIKKLYFYNLKNFFFNAFSWDPLHELAISLFSSNFVFTIFFGIAFLLSALCILLIFKKIKILCLFLLI